MPSRSSLPVLLLPMLVVALGCDGAEETWTGGGTGGSGGSGGQGLPLDGILAAARAACA